MSNLLEQLSAPFPQDAISWRAQNVTKDGTKALALAYIDARDVMNRLDEVVGAERWQCRYTFAGAITICEIGIKVGDEWVWKSNGAGNTDVEAEKGAASDAFKRAAVLWGVGRYLYALESVWVPCDSYQRGDGKFAWSKWKGDPWAYVKNVPTAAKPSAQAKPSAPVKKAGGVFDSPFQRNNFTRDLIALFADTHTEQDLKDCIEISTTASKLKALADGTEDEQACANEIRKAYGSALMRVRESEANATRQAGAV